jgi:hypothetical protein
MCRQKAGFTKPHTPAKPTGKKANGHRKGIHRMADSAVTHAGDAPNPGPEVQSKPVGATQAKKVGASQQSVSLSGRMKHAPLKSNDIFGDLMAMGQGL